VTAGADRLTPRRAAFLDRLRSDDRRIVSPPAGALAAVCADPRLIADLVHALDEEDAIVRRRAADIIEKTTRRHPEWLEPHREILLHRVTARADGDDVLCRLIPLVPRLAPTGGEMRPIGSSLFALLDGPGRQLQVCAMQALHDLSTDRRRLRKRLRTALERKRDEGSPAVRTRARRLLAESGGRPEQSAAR
jgi:hypothetical protein